jgi:hypothetical protein
MTTADLIRAAFLDGWRVGVATGAHHGIDALLAIPPTPPTERWCRGWCEDNPEPETGARWREQEEAEPESVNDLLDSLASTAIAMAPMNFIELHARRLLTEWERVSLDRYVQVLPDELRAIDDDASEAWSAPTYPDLVDMMGIGVLA